MATEKSQRRTLDGGLKQLIEAPRMPVDRGAELTELLDGFASTASVEMRSMCSAPLTLTLNEISSGKTANLLESYHSGFAAIFCSPELPNRIVIGCDRRLVFSMIEAMCGGDGSEAPQDSYRPFTELEAVVMRDVLIRMSILLQRQMSSACTTGLVLERADSVSDSFANQSKDAPALVAQFVIQIMGGGGSLFVVFPDSVLSALQSRADSEQPSEPSQLDVLWSHQLQQELGRTAVELHAVLDGTQLSIRELGDLRPGRILALSSSLNSSVHLEAEDKTLFTATLRQSHGLFTVCIEGRFDEREQLWSDIFDAR